MAELPDQLKPVNPPVSIPDWVGEYKSAYTPPNINPESGDYMLDFNNTLNKLNPQGQRGFPVVPGREIDFSGRFPLFFPGRDNEEMYAQSQGVLEKVYNGVVKFSGIAGTTFLNGTAGLIYGTYKAIQDGKFSSLHDNELSRSLNEFSESLDVKYANYKTLREREGDWWEPANLFTANFLMDDIIRNLGFTAGTIAGGFGWGALFKGIGLSAGIAATGARGAAVAEEAIAAATILPKVQRLPSAIANLQKSYTTARASLGRGLLKGDRAVIAAFGTAGEAGIEALHNSQQYRENLINEFIEKRGYSPNKEELEEINKYAESVGNVSYILNTFLLAITNYIQLPKIVGSSVKAERNILNNIQYTGKEYISSLPEKGFGKRFYQFRNAASLFFSSSEAFEEGSQFAIQSGTQNYFNRKYGEQEASVLEDGLLAGVRETLASDEGWLNITIGGLSGAIMMAPRKVGERGVFGYGGEKRKLREEALTSLNNSRIREKLIDAYKTIKSSESIQQDREAAIRRGDILESKDLEFDYAHNFITSRLKYNAKEAIDFELQSLREQAATEEGFSQLKQEGTASELDTRETFLRRLDNIQQHASNTAALYDALNLKYKGLVNRDTQERVYSDKAIDAMVYAASKVADYDGRIPDISLPLIEAGVDVQSILNDVLVNNAPSEEVVKKALSDIETLNSINEDDLKLALHDVIETSLRRKQFLNEYNEIKGAPQTYQEEPLPSQKTPTEQQTIKVKTKDGEEELSIGEEYFLGRVVEYDEQGKEVYRFPKLTILGENEDGTIKIKDSNGNVRDVKSSVLEDYKLGKVSDTLANKKAKFFMENANNVFEFNFGKGRKQRGRLEYSPKEGILNFVYKDRNGRIKSIEVTGKQFIPREGFTTPIISKVGTLSAAEQKSIDEFAKEEDKRATLRRESRLKILNDLYTEVSDRHTSTQKLISQKQSELSNLQKDLTELKDKIEQSPLTPKRGGLKASIRRGIQSSLRLTRMQEQLEQEIESLEAERDELELNASYITDISQNIDVLPTDSKEFLQELKNQKSLLEDLILKTGDEINIISRLIDNVETALKSAIDFVSDIIDEFVKKYPKVPLALGQEWVDFIKNNPNFLKLKPNYREDLRQLEDIVAQIEDIDIVPNERPLSELRNELENLQKTLQETEKELQVKNIILSRFQEIADEYKKEEEEKRKIVDNTKLKQQLRGTAYTGTATEPSTKPYEPESKKTDVQVVTSTIAATESKSPHHVRTNAFGFNFHEFENKDEIVGALVTSKIEDQLGLAGLTQFLKDQSDLPQAEKDKIDPSTTIVMVMVDRETRKPVGVDGKILDTPNMENSIFQVMPLPKLSWDRRFGEKGEEPSMFREDTPKDKVEFLKQQYKKAVDRVLSSTSPILHEFSPSLGIFEYVQIVDEEGKSKRDFSAVTPVTQIGVIEPADLQTNQILEVSNKDGSINIGDKTFKAPLGRVFLHALGNILPLNNRNLTTNEAETIYGAIHQLSLEIFEEGTLDTEKAKRLYNWLKTVIYWGKPQNAKGYSSVFLSDDMSTLEMGRDVEKISFTPSQIEQNKDRIISILENMYNNVNNTWLTKEELWNAPYEEIIEITDKGEIKSRNWVNYQTYLLSDKIVTSDKNHPDNGKTRNLREIPLFTNIRPITDVNPTNRKGIYFTITDTGDSWSMPKKEEKKIISPAPTQKKYTLDGETINTFVSPAGKKVNFVASTTPESVKVLRGEDLDEVLAALSAQVGEEKAKENIKNTIITAISPQFTGKIETEFTIPSEPAIKIEKTEEGISEEKRNAIFDRLRKKSKGPINRDDLRIRIEEQASSAIPENWTEVETWLKSNFPNLPVYRVRNIIKGVNGLQAWGMLKDGAIYVYENAEVGTIYHEVFEAVWKIFADPKEQAAVISEFRQREGSFIDRPTGKTIKYSEASAQEIKEQLAEEFRDYIQDKKIPLKPKRGKPFIVKLFADIFTFIKSFFTGNKASSNTEALFQKIGTGYYKQYTPTSALSFAKKGIIDIEDAFASYNSELRIALPPNIVNDIIQQMVWKTFKILTKDGENLFSVEKKDRGELFKELKQDLHATIEYPAEVAVERMDEVVISMKEGKLSEKETNKIKEEASRIVDNAILTWKKVEENWEEIKKVYEENLSKYAIEFDENDELQKRDEDKVKESNYVDATKVDAFRKANGAVKLLLSTIPILDSEGEVSNSSINGVQLVPSSRAYISIKNRVHSARSIDEMMDMLREMGEEDITYSTVYQRLTTKLPLSDVEKKYQSQLLSAFWKTFKQQNADVKVVYILENGDIEVGDSNLSTAARQQSSEYVNNIIRKFKRKNPYFEYSEKARAYIHKKAKGKSIITTVPVDTPTNQIKFLKELGVSFTLSEYRRLSRQKQKQFSDSVKWIKISLEKASSVKAINTKTLDISKRLLTLGLIRASIDNPEFNSTFFNVNGERVQTYIGVNAISNLHDYLSKVENIRELENSPYSYLLTDVFSKNSVILKRMFHPDTGDRIAGTENLMRAGWADGTLNLTNGKNRQSSKQTYKERLLQEFALNQKGYYYTLVPGDASMEHITYMGIHVPKETLASGYTRVNEIFEGYFMDELNLIREGRPVAKGRGSDEFRFFDDILDDKIKEKILRSEKSAEDVYQDNKPQIDNAVIKYIEEQIKNNQALLEEYKTQKEESTIKSFTVNYIISNIEYHKLVFSDPFQYSDEQKRVKSALSPRQPLISNSPNMNQSLHKIWNEGFKEGDSGWTDFTRDYFKTNTLADVETISELKDYGVFVETDGAGIISMKANRWLRIKAGDWNDNEERQYRYDMEYEKIIKGPPISEEELKLLRSRNPRVTSAYKDLKPIVFGNEVANQEHNSVILDKYSLYPLSFRIMHEINPTSNAIKLYNKMQREDRDYVVFGSGRKVGITTLHSPYKENGEFNNEAFPSSTNIPHSIISIQQEVPSKDDWRVTKGSQMTKLSTLDFMEAGVPLDVKPEETDFSKRYEEWYKLSKGEKNNTSPLYKEIKNNQELLELSIENGVNSLLKRSGIALVDGDFKINDITKLASTLKEEISKRKVNDNILDALEAFKNGKLILEATPLYFQIRNILYSIADKEVISPKISGGERVQIPVTFLESTRTKHEKGNFYSSGDLKFYNRTEEGIEVAEIMVSRWWFENDVTKNMTDDELLNLLNTKENQHILQGVGYRIPTQKQNSIEVFKVIKLLPREFGNSIVVPSEIVRKVGSDFDIDKLNVFLKNIFITKDGKIKAIEYRGSEQATKDFYSTLYDEIHSGVKEGTLGEQFKDILGSVAREEEDEKYIASRETFVEKMYKKALENAYIESLYKLISHPLNFDQLIKPNDAQPLKDLATKITKQRGRREKGLKEFDYKAVGNMMSWHFMSRLRQAFVSGKYAIGIAAVNQTNHSLNQRQPFYIDPKRFKNLNTEDLMFLSGGTGNINDIKIRFKDFNSLTIEGQQVPTLSMIKNKADEPEFISDILGMFIDGYVDISKGPWIMELGATPNVASTWLFLAKIGVPIEDVAYFMNQPIIRDYLQAIENEGYSWLFIDDIAKETLDSYKSSPQEINKVKQIPSKTKLFEYIGKEKFSSIENAHQQFILKEFLKYARMAQHLFYVTQGSNFDTANFSDPYLISRKIKLLEKARNTIFSDVDGVLKNSFLGDMKNALYNVRDAFSTVLTSDRYNVRDVIEKTLDPYIEKVRDERDFLQIARKAVSTLFDWAVQTDGKLNLHLQDILLSENNAAEEIQDFVNSIKSNEKHPLYNNQVINLIALHSSDRKNSPNNLKIKNKDNKVYDQNQMIAAFREIKHYIGDRNTLYSKLVALSVLQSGLSGSPISFTHLLPYEDFMDVYNGPISKLETLPNINVFNDLNVFQRVNWNNGDIVPHRKAKWVEGEYGKKYNKNMKFTYLPALKKAIDSKTLPRLLKLDSRSREADMDVIVYSWEEGTTAEKKEMRKQGDFSYIKKSLFKKVYRGDTPLFNTYKIGDTQIIEYIYKPINAWGASYASAGMYFSANEFYTIGRPSIIDNGFLKIDEVADQTIIDVFDGKKPQIAESRETGDDQIPPCV